MAPWETGPIAMPPGAQAPPSLSPPPTLSPPPSLPVARAVAQAPWEPAPEPTGAGPAEPAAPGPAAAGPGAAGPATGSHLGMPIRVPQANMAPQLRAQRDADPQTSQEPPDRQDDEPWFGARSPEATRSMLTMMQQGWRRGRMDDLDDPEGVPGMGTD